MDDDTKRAIHAFFLFLVILAIIFGVIQLDESASLTMEILSRLE